MAAKEVFLSYGREVEVVNFVTHLKHDLEKNGFSVWLDTEDIPAGCDWHGAIGTGLDKCKALIAVITPKYIESRYCTGELYTADGDQKLIFPVIFQDVDFSSSDKARGVKYTISAFNWTMFRPSLDIYETSLAKLMAGMRAKGLQGNDTADAPVASLAEQMGQTHLSPSAPAYPSPSAPPHPSHPPQSSPYGYSHHQQQQAPPPGRPHSPYYPHQPPPAAPVAPSPYTTPTPSPGSHYYPSPGPHPQESHHHPSPAGTPYYPPHPSHPSHPPHPSHPSPMSGQGGYWTSPSPSAPQQHHPYAPPAPVPYGGYPPEETGPPGAHYQPPPGYSEVFPTTQQQPPLPNKQAAAAPVQPPPLPHFKVGMKLECVDQRFPYFVCVATIMNRRDEEVMIHFDGWSAEYDYWCSRSAVELHPARWCQKHNWDLQAPLNQEWHGWDQYLLETEADSAGEELFTTEQLAAPGSLLFQQNMKLEAKDRKNPSIIAVATILEVQPAGGMVLIHLEGHERSRDYWCERGSTDLHPPMWCGKNGKKVSGPPGYEGQFLWNQYLANPAMTPAPAHLFNEEQLSSGATKKSVQSLSGFQVGMRLEAKDRLNPTTVAVAMIDDIRDEQLLIHFDGWTTRYDYWCRPDSSDIHPVGWCAREGRDVNPPNGHLGAFTWSGYLSSKGFTAAPEKLFTDKQKSQKSVVKFEVGMKLEAKDRLNPSLIAVATITEISDGLLLVHFDGWTTKYDYWCSADTDDIHPVGWCHDNGKTLQPPKGHSSFSWSSYLSQTAARAAPKELFNKHSSHSAGSTASSFQVGMRLEAKDRQYPTLTCVATITSVQGKKLLIHFDGWNTSYDYWCESSSTDIHPAGWCKTYGRKLNAPKDYPGGFTWDSYLSQGGFKSAPKNLFTKAQCS